MFPQLPCIVSDRFCHWKKTPKKQDSRRKTSPRPGSTCTCFAVFKPASPLMQSRVQIAISLGRRNGPPCREWATPASPCKHFPLIISSGGGGISTFRRLGKAALVLIPVFSSRVFQCRALVSGCDLRADPGSGATVEIIGLSVTIGQALNLKVNC